MNLNFASVWEMIADLIPDNEEEKFLTLLEMGIKLIMIQPKVKKMCKLLPCF